MKIKRIAALVAALAFLCSLSGTALAADPPTTDVYGSYVSGGGAGAPVYSYSYEWGSMQIQYVAAGQPEWNPKTHQYDGPVSTTGAWAYPNGTNNIVIANHSNAPITANALFVGTEERFKGGFVNNGAEIESAEGTSVQNAPRATLQFRMLDTAGGLTAADGDSVKLGTITLQIKTA